MRLDLITGWAALGLTLAATTANAQAGKDPSGTWLTEDGRARVRVEKCGANAANVCGYISWLKDPLTPDGKPRLDIHNPDASKRSRQALGMQILLGLQPDGAGKYKGQVYNAEEGKNYEVTVWLEQPNEFRIRGCVLGGLFCGSQAWSRVADTIQTGSTTVVPKTGPGAGNKTGAVAPKNAPTAQ